MCNEKRFSNSEFESAIRWAFISGAEWGLSLDGESQPTKEEIRVEADKEVDRAFRNKFIDDLRYI